MDDGLKIDAEEAVISALMVDKKCIEKVYGMLSPDMFTNAVYGRAYLEYCRAFDRGKEVTLAEVQQALAADGYKDYEIEDALRSALQNSLTSAEVVGSARVVASKYKTSCADAILSRTELVPGKIDEQIDLLIHDLETIRSGETSDGHTVAEIAEQYSEDYFCEKENELVLLNEEEIDGMTGGFQGGDMVLLGGRPASGKSALAAQWAWDMACRGLKVGYYNCEMQERSVFERFVASMSGIETTRLRLAKKFLNDEEERYRNAVSELRKQNNLMLFTGAKKVSEIRNDVREKKFSVVFVDYLQLLICESRYQGNRAAEVGEISRSLKQIAMDYNVPLICLTQLNRASEGRQNKEPQLSELRESGSLEQDASVVFLIWGTDETDTSKKSMKICKSRNGKIGQVNMVFDGSHLRFTLESKITPFDGR